MSDARPEAERPASRRLGRPWQWLVVLAVAAIICALGVGLPKWREHRRESADRAVARNLEVVKDYVQAWAVENGDTYPPAEVVCEERLGYLAQVDKRLPNWPVNPFDGQPMRPGTSPGDYQYVPAGDSFKPTVGNYPAGWLLHEWFRMVGYGHDGTIVATLPQNQ